MSRVLLVINMVNDYVERGGTVYCGEAVEDAVASVARLIEDEAWQRIVFVCDAHDEKDPEFERQPVHCVRGSWGAEVTTRLPQVQGAIYVQKQRYSGFFNTGLEEELRRAEASEVHVVGLRTSVSVMDTVAGLYERAVERVVIHEAGLIDGDPEQHRSAMERMKTLYGVSVV